MENLTKVLKGINVLESGGSLTCDITQITFDSRFVTKGSLFVAVKGTKVDGHDFISVAIGSGAVAVICQVLPEITDKKICLD